MELTRENISLYRQIGTMIDDICEKYFDKVGDDTWQFYSDWGVCDEDPIVGWSGDLYTDVIDCIEWLIKESCFNKEYLGGKE